MKRKSKLAIANEWLDAIREKVCEAAEICGLTSTIRLGEGRCIVTAGRTVGGKHILRFQEAMREYAIGTEVSKDEEHDNLHPTLVVIVENAEAAAVLLDAVKAINDAIIKDECIDGDSE